MSGVKKIGPIFSVPVARATAHRGWDGAEFPAAVYWRKEKETWRVGEGGMCKEKMGKEGGIKEEELVAKMHGKKDAREVSYKFSPGR